MSLSFTQTVAAFIQNSQNRYKQKQTTFENEFQLTLTDSYLLDITIKKEDAILNNQYCLVRTTVGEDLLLYSRNNQIYISSLDHLNTLEKCGYKPCTKGVEISSYVIILDKPLIYKPDGYKFIQVNYLPADLSHIIREEDDIYSVKQVQRPAQLTEFQKKYGAPALFVADTEDLNRLFVWLRMRGLLENENVKTLTSNNTLKIPTHDVSQVVQH
jgi:hypothetical protein